MAKGQRYILIATFIFLLLSGISQAEPDSTIKYLMNEPLSMLDWGIYRMERSLELKFGNKYQLDHSLIYTVRYDWGNNKIIVNCGVGLSGRLESKKVAKAAAKNIIRSIRGHLGVNTDSGKPYEYGNLFDKFFAHTGFKRDSEPKQIVDKLYHLIEIYIDALFEGGSVKCTAPLLGKDIYFQE